MELRVRSRLRARTLEGYGRFRGTCFRDRDRARRALQRAAPAALNVQLSHGGALPAHYVIERREAARSAALAATVRRVLGYPPRQRDPSVRDRRWNVAHSDDSKKMFTIIVNAQKKQWGEKEISYDEVVQLAFPDPPPPGVVITYTVEYERGEGQKPEGSLVRGGPPAKVKEGMIFGVTETGRS